MGSMIQYVRPDDQSVNAYLAEPQAGSGAPGLVVIQEWWGLDQQIKDVADQLAQSGYRALVPDLYRGKLALEAKEAEHLMGDLNFGEVAGQDIRGAVLHLKKTGSPAVGVTGFCMGGALTLLSAVHVPEADASVVWYGYPPLEYIDATAIKKPIMGHWALHDAFFPIAGVDQLEASFTAAHVPFEFHRYDAKHAFTNPESDSRHMPPLQYNPEASKKAWQRTHAFLKMHLG